MKDNLGIGGRLHHGALVHKVAPQLDAVGEVAVMPDSETAAFEFCKQRLHIAQDGFAGGRIAHVAHRGRAGQAVNHFAPGESVTDQTETTFRVEAFAIEGDDAGCFLTSVLEGVQTERGDGGRVRVAENAKHPTFFTQAVGVGIELRISHRPVVLWGCVHRYRVPLALGCVSGNSERWSGFASGTS